MYDDGNNVAGKHRGDVEPTIYTRLMGETSPVSFILTVLVMGCPGAVSGLIVAAKLFIISSVFKLPTRCKEAKEFGSVQSHVMTVQ